MWTTQTMKCCTVSVLRNFLNFSYFPVRLYSWSNITVLDERWSHSINISDIATKWYNSMCSVCKALLNALNFCLISLVSTNLINLIVVRPNLSIRPVLQAVWTSSRINYTRQSPCDAQVLWWSLQCGGDYRLIDCLIGQSLSSHRHSISYMSFSFNEQGKIQCVMYSTFRAIAIFVWSLIESTCNICFLIYLNILTG